MKIYIAGKITGVPDYKEHFARAREKLEQQGYTVLDPSHLPGGLTPADYMRICLAMVESADIICLLPGWQDSPGADIERSYAKYIGKGVWDLENDVLR